MLAVLHIGSTSIPGIHAKPVIDILAIVDDLHAVDGRTADMQALGYEVLGEFGIEGRRYLRRDDSTGKRTHLQPSAAWRIMRLPRLKPVCWVDPIGLAEPDRRWQDR